MKHPNDRKKCFRVYVLDEICCEVQKKAFTVEPLMKVMTNSIEDFDEWEEKEYL